MADTITIAELPLPSYIADHSLASIVPTYGIFVVVLSCVAIFLLSEFLTGKFVATFKSLPYIDRVRWHLKYVTRLLFHQTNLPLMRRAVSIVHATLATIAGFRIFYYDEQIFVDAIGGWSDLWYIMARSVFKFD